MAGLGDGIDRSGCEQQVGDGPICAVRGAETADKPHDRFNGMELFSGEVAKQMTAREGQADKVSTYQEGTGSRTVDLPYDAVDQSKEVLIPWHFEESSRTERRRKFNHAWRSCTIER